MSNINAYLKQAQVYNEENDEQLYSMFIDLHELSTSNDIDEIRTIASEFEEHGLTWDESRDVFYGTRDAWESYYNEEKANHEHSVAAMRKYRETDKYKKFKEEEDAHLKSKGLDWMIAEKQKSLAASEIFDLGNSFEEFFKDAKPYRY